MAGADQRLVFLGPPNSGKGTQAARLADKLAIPAISTGDMLRAAVASGSPLGERVKDVMARGELVNDDLMAEIVRERLAEPDAGRGFLLDGYPRTRGQAQTLDEILAEREATLHHVVLIDAPTDVLVARALGRGREDDKEEVVRERLEVYRRETAPLISLYDERGLLRRVDGDQTMDEVNQAILAAIHAT